MITSLTDNLLTRPPLWATHSTITLIFSPRMLPVDGIDLARRRPQCERRRAAQPGQDPGTEGIRPTMTEIDFTGFLLAHK
jgi:hypothetical protein